MKKSLRFSCFSLSRFSLIRLLTPALALATLSCLNAAPAPVPASEVAFTSQVQLGNIFTLGEKVQIEADIKTGTGADWYVTDFEGNKVASGQASVANGKVRFAPEAVGKGYYSVFVTSKIGQQTVGEGRTSYAVVPPADITKMPDSKFGIQTHFAQNMPTDMLPLLAKAGITTVRDEQYWGSVEKTKGTFDFSHFQGYMDALKMLRMEPLICMTFGNKAYDNQAGVPEYKLAPWNPETFDAYANYCVQVLNHYGNQIRVAEIWNEYNGTFCAGQAAKDRPKTYTEMLKVAYAKIKAARPDVQVLGAATVKIPLPYLDKLFKQGALAYMDGVAVHPYMSPDEAEQSLASLVAMMKKYNHGKTKSIWCTEYGWSQDKTPERMEAAQHLVRMSTCLLTQPEVAYMNWYLSRDYAPNFAVMGIVHDQKDPAGPLTPVMPYPAYANLISLLYGATFKQHVATDVRTRLYQFDKPSQQVWVCWSMFDNANIQLTAGGPVTLVNMVGGEKKLSPVNGKVTVSVGELPVYLVAAKGIVSGVSEAPRSDTVISDSEHEYGGPDTKSAWSYLYEGNDKTGSTAYDPGAAVPMQWTPSPGDWADLWSGPGKYFNVGASGAQPGGVSGGQGWAIRRWTSTVNGKVHIVARITTGTQGDGCGFKVFVDGKEMFSKLLPAKGKDTIDLIQEVRTGTKVDFVATPGPGTDTSFDNAGYRIQILTPSK